MDLYVYGLVHFSMNKYLNQKRSNIMEEESRVGKYRDKVV